MKRIMTFLLCSVLLIVATSAINPKNKPNQVNRNITNLNVNPSKAFQTIYAYDVAYRAVLTPTGYEVTLYFLGVTGPATVVSVAAPVAVTVNGNIGNYSGSITIPQGSSSYVLGTFTDISGGITSVSPTSIGGLLVYHDQPPGW